MPCACGAAMRVLSASDSRTPAMSAVLFAAVRCSTQDPPHLALSADSCRRAPRSAIAGVSETSTNAGARAAELQAGRPQLARRSDTARPISYFHPRPRPRPPHALRQEDSSVTSLRRHSVRVEKGTFGLASPASRACCEEQPMLINTHRIECCQRRQNDSRGGPAQALSAFPLRGRRNPHAPREPAHNFLSYRARSGRKSSITRAREHRPRWTRG